MKRSEADAILDRFAGKRVLVAGDLMVDEYIWGHVGRVSPEAPVLVVDAQKESFVPGGAANVANQLRALQATVVVAGVIGEDDAGARLRESLESLGIETDALIESHDRPTTRKTRVVAGAQQNAQQIVRVDRERRGPLPDAVAERLIADASRLLTDCDALLFSDYDKGVLGRATVRALVQAARSVGSVVVTANPKPPSARFYEDADVITLNKFEADQAAGTTRFEDGTEESFHAAGVRLRESLGVRNLLVTRSSDGLTVFRPDGFTDVPAHRVEVFDGTGAGDSTIAALTLGLAAGATLMEAVALGNAAGGAVVRKAGVAAASRDEIVTLFGP
ncbi:MAG: bifunctional hydroxymethylpyrimidine kinase/phosphomethylpyrimidine kinase [Cytophagales bacterium]|nr:bifunctional hydroxymethylpyrimidine kinase/phosphomethylpyrimidine kinase [Armatimonadota bacterium]